MNSGMKVQKLVARLARLTTCGQGPGDVLLYASYAPGMASGPGGSRNPVTLGSHQQTFKAEQSMIFTMAPGSLTWVDRKVPPHDFNCYFL